VYADRKQKIDQAGSDRFSQIGGKKREEVAGGANWGYLLCLVEFMVLLGLEIKTG
jgi:hypothetical protein